jgi:hypothetical protein
MNMRYFEIISIAFLVVGCGDNVTSHFNDIEHAKQEKAFERGWLLPILPPSTTNITEKNDLDLNIGEGSFSFDPSEIDHFINSGAEAIKIHASPDTDLANLQKKGFRLLSFKRDSSNWLIAIHSDGRGVYWLEP